MQEFTLYGKHSSLYEYAKMMIFKQAEKAGLQLKINEVSDTDQFIESGIMSIPAAKVNGQMIERGDRGINNFISEVNYKLLKRNNFGKMRKVIVPIDFSETSKCAFEYARHLNQYLNGVIKLLHVHTVGNAPVSNRLEDEKKLETYINNFEGPWHIEYDDLLIDSEFKTGIVEKEILAYANEVNSNWIVMGSRRDVNTSQMICGTIATKVAKNAKSPVLVIPGRKHFSPFNKIAYCVDNDFMDTNAMEELALIAGKLKSEIHLIRVDQQDGYCVNNLLEIWQEYFKDNKIIFHNVQGVDISKAINEYANEQEIDLIALSKSKRGFFEELFHKSVTKRMVLSSEKPVLIFHK